MTIHPSPIYVRVNKTKRRYVLAQPKLPFDLSLSADLRATLRSAELAIQNLPESNWSVVMHSVTKHDDRELAGEAVVPCIAALRHRLGDISVARLSRKTSGIPWRSEIERIVLNERYQHLALAISAGRSDDFIRELQAVSAAVRNLSAAALRDAGVCLAGDIQGWSWQFPPSSGIEGCLSTLHEFLHLHGTQNALVRATLAYGVINWMHPFADGNGRTSRIIFNAVLRLAGMPSGHYIPIKEINHLAHGGHEVRLRYTVATGEWEELLEYFVNAIRVYEVLLQREVLPNKSAGYET